MKLVFAIYYQLDVYESDCVFLEIKDTLHNIIYSKYRRS